MATRSPRRGSSRPASGKSRSRAKPAAAEAGSGDLEEVAARAARLGITAERVLQEYAAIAFADLRHLVEWGSDGLRIKPINEMSPPDVSAISEIVPGSDPEHSRLKLYDKKAALDAIARHLGMFPAAPWRRDENAPSDPAEDAREVLARRLARLSAGGAAS